MSRTCGDTSVSEGLPGMRLLLLPTTKAPVIVGAGGGFSVVWPRIYSATLCCQKVASAGNANSKNVDQISLMVILNSSMSLH